MIGSDAGPRLEPETENLLRSLPILRSLDDI